MFRARDSRGGGPATLLKPRGRADAQVSNWAPPSGRTVVREDARAFVLVSAVERESSSQRRFGPQSASRHLAEVETSVSCPIASRNWRPSWSNSLSRHTLRATRSTCSRGGSGSTGRRCRRICGGSESNLGGTSEVLTTARDRLCPGCEPPTRERTVDLLARRSPMTSLARPTQTSYAGRTMRPNISRNGTRSSSSIAARQARSFSSPTTSSQAMS